MISLQIGYTFLPSVLAGLSRAPQYITREDTSVAVSTKGSLWSQDIDCVVVPVNACGGAGTLAFSKKKHKVCAPITFLSFLLKTLQTCFKTEVKMSLLVIDAYSLY